METATTELTRLPGLEVAEAKPEVKPEHWIETGPSKRLMLFSGRSHPELAQRIAEKLGIQVGDVSLRTFADGSTYCRFEESIRGADLFLVQTSCPPVDQNLMELLIMIDAAKLASAKRITAVIPLYPYSRQDHKSRPREPISAKLDADMLQAQHMAHAVRRDIHKMKANLQLRPLQDAAGEIEVGCYEPAHHVIEAAAPWFAKRIPAARWALFTPDRSVRCERGRLLFGPGVPASELPGPAGSDADWLACYERVFAAHDRPAEHA